MYQHQNTANWWFLGYVFFLFCRYLYQYLHIWIRRLSQGISSEFQIQKSFLPNLTSWLPNHLQLYVLMSTWPNTAGWKLYRLPPADICSQGKMQWFTLLHFTSCTVSFFQYLHFCGSWHWNYSVEETQTCQETKLWPPGCLTSSTDFSGTIVTAFVSSWVDERQHFSLPPTQLSSRQNPRDGRNGLWD